MTVIVDNQACLRDIIAIGRHPGPDPLKLKAVETRIADYCRALRLRTREGPPAPSLIESLRQGMREIIAGELTRPMGALDVNPDKLGWSVNWKFMPGGDVTLGATKLFSRNLSGSDVRNNGNGTTTAFSYSESTEGYTLYDMSVNWDTGRYGRFTLGIENLFDKRYATFGNFFNLEAANAAAGADPSTGAGFFNDPRTVTPAMPFAAYGGIKVRF